ncbi:MAG TPA: ATP-binding protein, partial [Parafilimonas sp.]|nr:ATP-binding protein [Parafilimonas sp.]
MNIDWLKLRPFNGDIKNGFEELVCQLARTENIKDKKQFVRVAAPDGGVEAYCILTNGKEYGWQAKFFSSMEDAQWKQIDKSFKTAFDKHPNLVKYYICIPLDRQEPRIDKQMWFMDKWNEKVTEWKEFAQTNGRIIEFEYWGNSELFDRLSKPENEGKLYYWFGQEELSDNWFAQKLEESIQNLGERYTPEINFDLPIAKVFEGLSRDEFFEQQFILLLDDLLRKYNQAVTHVKLEKVNESIQKIDALIIQFRKLYEQIDFDEISVIDSQSLSLVLESCDKIIDSVVYKLYELDSEEKKKQKEKSEYVSDANNYGWEIQDFRKLSNSISEFINFLDGFAVNLSNNPFLILTGEAGIGKSHLLADVAEKRTARKQFTMLLLGQQFSTTEDPWTQIEKLLQIDCKRDTFLSALNSKAESANSRVLIFIDAINEGQGKIIWINHIASFIVAVKRFPNIGVVFSLRTSYEKLLIPDIIKEKKQAIKITHYGFANYEYEASKLFFESYGIKQPGIPLLHPEFTNPLFLKLFCKGLSTRGLHEIPDGYEGISTILNFFLEAINEKISTKHNQPTNLQIVQKVIKQIAGKIVDTNNSYMKYDEAFDFITNMKEAKSIIDKSQFFQDLISEGLLTENYHWKDSHNHFETVYISYERFSDHLVCSNLLENYLNKENPTESFKAGSRLNKLIVDNHTINYNQGIIEALSIQLPEMADVELFEAAPQISKNKTIAFAFLDSIIWRKKDTLHKKLVRYINEIVIKELGLNDYFLNTVLLVTSNPNHLFNSDFLHHHLMQFSMADRDEWWTQFIHKDYPGYPDEVSPIKRMIDWSWTNDKREHISHESIRLLCQTMIWLLTSCNRTLRDAATKAIICLLEERIDILMQLIQTFEQVNDPYVRQRLYAVAYGSAIRTTDTKLLKSLADLVFQKVFDVDEVFPDILLRDYAKGIIEFA